LKLQEKLGKFFRVTNLAKLHRQAGKLLVSLGLFAACSGWWNIHGNNPDHFWERLYAMMFLIPVGWVLGF